MRQYTGIKDETGREIYEGDIIKQSADCDKKFYGIRWNAECAAFIGENMDSSEILLFPNLKNIKVIGNIYDEVYGVYRKKNNHKKLMIKDGYSEDSYMPKALCSIGRDGLVDDCDTCSEYCRSKNGICSDCAIMECFKRLAEYEKTDLTIEQN